MRMARMTRMTRPNCAVMSNFINIHRYIPGTCNIFFFLPISSGDFFLITWYYFFVCEWSILHFTARLFAVFLVECLKSWKIESSVVGRLMGAILILRREQGQRNIHFPCSADYEQDWQPSLRYYYINLPTSYQCS